MICGVYRFLGWYGWAGSHAVGEFGVIFLSVSYSIHVFCTAGDCCLVFLHAHTAQQLRQLLNRCKFFSLYPIYRMSLFCAASDWCYGAFFFAQSHGCAAEPAVESL